MARYIHDGAFQANGVVVPLHEIRTVEVQRSFFGKGFALTSTVVVWIGMLSGCVACTIASQNPGENQEAITNTIIGMLIIGAIGGVIQWIGDSLSRLVIGTTQRNIGTHPSGVGCVASPCGMGCGRRSAA